MVQRAGKKSQFPLLRKKVTNKIVEDLWFVVGSSHWFTLCWRQLDFTNNVLSKRKSKVMKPLWRNVIIHPKNPASLWNYQQCALPRPPGFGYTSSLLNKGSLHQSRMTPAAAVNCGNCLHLGLGAHVFLELLSVHPFVFLCFCAHKIVRL